MLQPSLLTSHKSTQHRSLNTNLHCSSKFNHLTGLDANQSPRNADYIYMPRTTPPPSLNSLHQPTLSCSTIYSPVFAHLQACPIHVPES